MAKAVKDAWQVWQKCWYACRAFEQIWLWLLFGVGVSIDCEKNPNYDESLEMTRVWEKHHKQLEHLKLSHPFFYQASHSSVKKHSREKKLLNILIGNVFWDTQFFTSISSCPLGLAEVVALSVCLPVAGFAFKAWTWQAWLPLWEAGARPKPLIVISLVTWPSFWLPFNEKICFRLQCSIR